MTENILADVIENFNSKRSEILRRVRPISLEISRDYKIFAAKLENLGACVKNEGMRTLLDIPSAIQLGSEEVSVNERLNGIMKKVNEMFGLST